MTRQDHRAIALANAQKAFHEVPEDIREDILAALLWARDTLRDREGLGHQFHLHATADGWFYCSFAKPEWAGDHGGNAMPTAGEAVVWAVCEYLNGL